MRHKVYSQYQDKVLKKITIENEILNRKEISLKEEVNKLNSCSENKRTELEITHLDHESKSLEFSTIEFSTLVFLLDSSVCMSVIFSSLCLSFTQL